MNIDWKQLLIKVLCFVLGAALGVPVCDFLRSEKKECPCPKLLQCPGGRCPIPGVIPQPPAPPGFVPHPKTVAAIVRLRCGSAGCTATILPYGKEPNKWYVLTADHCVGGLGSRCAIVLQDGRSYLAVVTAKDRRVDIALLTVETSDLLPSVGIADHAPSPGAAIYHKGYGVNRPGSLDRGRVVSQADEYRWSRYSIPASSGDSGSGLFQESDGRLVGILSATDGRYTLGAGWEAVRAFLVKNIS